MERETHPAVPRPAATVVLVRDGPRGLEVLLTQRPATMAFAANVHVFPGGAIEAGDREGLPADDEDSAARVAGVRELWEEAGIALVSAGGGAGLVGGRGGTPAAEVVAAGRRRLLDGESIGEVAARLGLEVRADRLAPLSRWVTPPFVSRRFDTRFFVAELPAGAVPSFVGGEVVAHRWCTPREALDARAAGEISLWVPTSATLQQLEHAGSFDEIREQLAPGRLTAIHLADVAPGIVRVELPAAGGIAGQAVNAWVVGRHELVVIDPGDPSEAAADALLALADSRVASIRAVAITHADPDHAAGAEALALRLGVPLFGGVGSGHDLPAEVHELADGDRVAAGDLELVAIAAPGPRSDHTVFVAPEPAVVAAGDLVGRRPARSILGPIDVPAWLASLDRVEALGSTRLLPGHGDVPPDARAAIETQRRRLPPA